MVADGPLGGGLGILPASTPAVLPGELVQFQAWKVSFLGANALPFISARPKRWSACDGLHDSPLEGRVYCELVSEKGDCGAWLIRPDSRGFLDDKTSVRALFLALISQGISFLVPRQLRDILVLSY